MKRLFLLSAAVLMVLAGCTKNEVIQHPDQEITFSAPVVGAVTKANVPGEIATPYPVGENFRVYAVYHQKDFDTWKDKQIYMNAVECSHNNESWHPSPAYYWPKVGKLTFAAYSPAVADGQFAYGENGLSIANYTTPAVSAQYDLMYSNRTYNRTTSSDDATNEGEDHGNNYKGVDIKFNHALSSIVFKVKTVADYSAGAIITLKNVTLNNINSHGNFSEKVSENNGSTYSSTPTWTYDTPVNYSPIVQTQENSFAQVLTSEAASITNAYPLLMIPQKLDNATVTVNYTIKSQTGDAIEQTQTIYLSIVDHNSTDNGVQAEWILGKRYVYTISIGLTEIFFDPYVTAWDEKEISFEEL